MTARRHWARRARRALGRVGVYSALVVAAVFSAFPIIWAFLTSLKTDRNVAAFPPQWIPDPLTLEHYKSVWPTLAGQMGNSAFIAVCTIALTLIFATHGAYAAARTEFPFKRTILFVILAAMMIPGIAVLIPLYMVTSQLGLFNTYSALIAIYSAWMIPMALWLLKGFFETVPRDLEDAAVMDGCSRLGVLYRVAVPLVTPGLAAVAIVVFIYVWNEFIIALSLTTTEEKRVVTVGIYYYITSYGIDWGRLTAAVCLAMLPIVVGFFVLQRGFIQGMTAGATKG